MKEEEPVNEKREPEIQDVPIGIAAKGARRETDSLGEIDVRADRYWGAQTQRSLVHFTVGDELMPGRVVHAYGHVKKAAALVNAAAGRLPLWKSRAIVRASEEVASGKLDDHFPLRVWQSGSGTQTNMNANEVIANRAIQLLGGAIGSKSPVHPNDDVNLGQSTNDTFPTAIHVAAVLELEERLLPRAENLARAIEEKATAWMEVVKIGRTHLQDAVPLTVGQEWSGWAHQLRDALARVRAAEAGLLELAAGGTAVGTGLNAPPGFGAAIAAKLAELLGHPFVTAPNKFAAQASLDALVAASAAVRGLAVALFKVANDLRWLASGPRCGLGELALPENEPGSSIMPGKVNPTQCEVAVMVAVQAIGDDAAVAFAGTQGHFELNAMRPLVARNLLRSARLLGDACEGLRRFAIEGTRLEEERIRALVDRSLMLVTALAPEIGYDKASKIARHAHEKGTTLREAALALGFIDAARFDAVVDPKKMTGSGLAGC
jgi:fumarate hydratase class II